MWGFFWARLRFNVACWVSKAATSSLCLLDCGSCRTKILAVAHSSSNPKLHSINTPPIPLALLLLVCFFLFYLFIKPRRRSRWWRKTLSSIWILKSLNFKLGSVQISSSLNGVIAFQNHVGFREKAKGSVWEGLIKRRRWKEHALMELWCIHPGVVQARLRRICRMQLICIPQMSVIPSVGGKTCHSDGHTTAGNGLISYIGQYSFGPYFVDLPASLKNNTAMLKSYVHHQSWLTFDFEYAVVVDH